MVIEELFAKIGFKVDRESLARANKALSSVREGAGRIVSAIKPLHAALLGTAGALGIGGLAKAALNASMQMESLRTQFGVLLQDMNAGAALFEKVHAMAVATPFDDKSLSKATSTLLAYGVAGDKVMETLTMLGDVAGADNTKLQYLALVYGQVMNAGRLKGDDLRQMVNWGVNPLGIIAEKRGISYAEATDLMSKRMISAEEVADAFRTMTSEGGRFYKSTEKMAQTFQGRWNQLKGTLFNVAAMIGDELAPAVKNIMRAVSTANFDPLIDVVRDIGYYAEVAVDKVLYVIANWDYYMDAVKEGIAEAIDFVRKLCKTFLILAPLIAGAFAPKIALEFIHQLNVMKRSLRDIAKLFTLLGNKTDFTFTRMMSRLTGVVAVAGTLIMVIQHLRDMEKEELAANLEDQDVREFMAGKSYLDPTGSKMSPEILLEQTEAQVKQLKERYTAARKGNGNVAEARTELSNAVEELNHYKLLYYKGTGMHWESDMGKPDVLKTFNSLKEQIREQTAATEAQTKATKEQTKAITAISYGKSAFDAKFNVRLKEMVTAAYST